MESLFEQTLKPDTETNNLLYNAINTEDPKQLFLYISIIIVITFISTKIIYNTNILIGLVFCALIIYYLYTYRKYNILTNNEKFSEKFNSLYTENNIINKYPRIVDFLFYLQNFKFKNIESFNTIINSFEKFCQIYEFCLIDFKLIFTNYQKLVDWKITILNQINNLNFIYKNVDYEDILFMQKISAEKIIDELLNNLVILSKKQIYYNGYYNTTKKIDYSNVLPYNILNEPNYNKHTDQYNPSNLLVF